MAGKRVVIIGSGLGGLSCGVVLSKNGYDVTVVEQNAQIGGCLQCFSRRGARFETGMHFIGSAAPGQTMHAMMRYLGLDGDVRLAPLDTDAYNVITLGEREYRMANGREEFIESLAALFPKERENLRRYWDTVGLVAGASGIVAGADPAANSAIQSRYQQLSIDKVIAGLTSDTELASVLVGDMPLYAAERGRTPFTTHAFIADFYNQSAFRIAGGSDTIAKSLARTICQNGGTVRASCPATRIVCDDTRATAVEIGGSEAIECDYVISDAHPLRTLELLSSRLIRPAFRQRIAGLRQTIGCFAIYIHFKEGAVEYMNHNHFHYRTEENPAAPWECEKYTEENWPLNYLYMHFCDGGHQRHAKTGVLLAYMRADDVGRWAGTHVGRRGEDYEDFKRRKAERLLRVASARHPELRDGIEHYYTSTPLTYLDYTGTEGGSMYGVAKDIAAGAACRVPHRTKVPNVLLTGQNINNHGMLGVLVGTMVTCRELVAPDILYKQIWQAR